jgi:threonine/homoserine/homoserine lactone efflux protein
MAEFAAAFLPALLIGLSIAAPVGPIGLLVIQRTLQRGRVVGLATGLGAAAADAAYGAIGAFGVQGLIRWFEGARVPLALLGGGFLLWLACRTWTAAAPEHAAAATGDRRGLLGAFAGTFLLTLSNPATIFSFMAIFATLGARAATASPWPMIVGVLVGSALWWLLLSGVVGALRQRFDVRWRRVVSRTSAVCLGGFALWQWAAIAAP